MRHPRARFLANSEICTRAFSRTEHVDNVAYRLELSPAWRIHGVILVDHLEPATLDIFGCELPMFGAVRMSDYLIDRIVNDKIHCGKPVAFRT